MARPLRIQFPNAVYHVAARGNARQKIFHDERDYGRLLQGLEATVDKFGFEVFSFVCMPNHVHLFFRTPRPNLSRGMQYLLSGYANWFNTRHQRAGHLFQGRFKGELIEDDSYFWNVSRYVHLNPVRGKRPLVKFPEDWPWSSYPGYRWNRKRVAWLAYDSIYRAWLGEHGGKHAETAYRRFVAAGTDNPPPNPFQEAIDGWLLGSQAFVNRIKEQIKQPKYGDEVPLAGRLASVSLDDVLEFVAAHYNVAPESFAKKHSKERSRDVAAWMARRVTTATLRELTAPFGLGHPDSVRNLIHRVSEAMSKSPKFHQEINALLRSIQTKKTKTGSDPIENRK